MGAFRLDKWYLDLVTDEGAAVVVYAARLAMGPLALGYGSVLDASGEGAVRIRTHLGRPRPPRVEGRDLAFASAPLGVRLRLSPLDPAAGATFYASPQGSVRWRCDAPRARATVELDGRVLSGLGYAEQVRLTLPPWRLPIEELRWGRALGEAGSLVWVDWSGPGHQARLVLRDGVPVEAGAISDREVVAADGTVLARWGEGRVLRSGWLSRTVGPSLPAALRRRLPGAALRLHETKWCAEATLAGGAPARTIHEVVRWR